MRTSNSRISCCLLGFRFYDIRVKNCRRSLIKETINANILYKVLPGFEKYDGMRLPTESDDEERLIKSLSHGPLLPLLEGLSYLFVLRPN